MNYSLPLGIKILWFGCDVGTLCTAIIVCETLQGRDKVLMIHIHLHKVLL